MSKAISENLQVHISVAFLIKAMNRPQLESEEVMLEHINTTRYVKGKSRWQPLEITLYDPIIPSAAQQVHEWILLHHESVTGTDGYSDFYKKLVKFNLIVFGAKTLSY